MTRVQILTTIGDGLNARWHEALDAGKHMLATKLCMEKHYLARYEIAQVIDTYGVDCAAIVPLAVYALQKARRILQAKAGQGRIDPYTAHMIRNARQSAGELGSVVARTTLAGGAIEGMKTRFGALTTANTQVCSSRQALIALGIADLKINKGRKDLVFNLNHELIREVA